MTDIPLTDAPPTKESSPSVAEVTTRQKVTSPVPLRRERSQMWLFQWLRWRMIRNSGAALSGSRMRTLTMILSCLLVAGMMFYGAKEGFALIIERVPLSGKIVGLILDIMFFTLGTMLVFSTGLILYAGLFTGAETRFLLTTPARSDQIFATKFQAAALFSSAAFLVLGAPILIAYGIAAGASTLYYLLLPIFFLGFVLIPAASGAVGCLLLVNFFPKKRKETLGLLILCIVILGVIFVYRAVVMAKDAGGNRDALMGVFALFGPMTSNISPSRWISGGLMTLANRRDDMSTVWTNLALLWSNGLMMYLVAAFLAKLTYRRGFNRLSAEQGPRKRHGEIWADRIVIAVTSWLPMRTRTLILKDFLTFRREPAQVGQLGIFAGLVLLCVVNARQFVTADITEAYQQILSVLNLCAIGLLMCAYLGRFVYPLISLEGRKFWILGLLPLKRDELLWGKFAFAVSMTLTMAGFLTLCSDLILGIGWKATLLHGYCVICLAVGLSGLSVGISAWLPNFRETDPSKIVVGFGGTLFTVIGLVFYLLIVGVVCLPYHLGDFVQSLKPEGSEKPLWVYSGIPVGGALAIIAMWLPMRIGAKKLRTMEF